MKKILFITLYCMAALPIFAQNPEQLITQMISMMDKNALQANFTLALQEDMIDDPDIYRGTIRMKGNKFHLSMGDNEVYYDGTTQAVYNDDANELTITHPTADDLAGTNPLLILKQFKRTSKIEFYDKQQSKDNYIIVFYPKELQSEIRKLIVTLRKDNTLPTKLVLEASRGNVTTLVLTNLKHNHPMDDKYFTISNTQYPNAIINDLR